MSWADKYLNLGATNNGDGTASNDAASPGAAGAWNTWGNAVTGLGTLSVPTRCNVKGSITLSGALSLNSAGLSITVPLWWRGYNTTPGDIEADNTLTKPLTTQGTNAITVSTNYQEFSGLAFTCSSTASAAIVLTSANIWFHRCRITATGANSASNAINGSSAAFTASGCYFSANALADVLKTTTAGGMALFGNYISGGLIGINSVTSISGIGNVIDGCSGHGMSATVYFAVGNSVYGIGGKSSVDGMRASSGPSHIIGNLISNFNGTSNNGINFTASSGLNGRMIANAFYNCTNNIAGQVESMEFLGNGTLGSDPFTNATGHDLSVVPVARDLGFPSEFENASFRSYMDLGAAQRREFFMGGFMGPYVNV